MKVGIISDSHDNLPIIMKAVSLLNQENVDFVLHAGDIVSPFALDLLFTLNQPLYVTFGNNDGERIRLKEMMSANKKCTLIWPKITIMISNHKVALLHGEDEELAEVLASNGIYDLVVYGHSHKVVKKIFAKGILVNPGELCGYLTGKSTLAIVDLERRDVRIVKI